MELVLRILITLASWLAFLLNTVLNWIYPRKHPDYPPIRNKLLTKSLSELIVDLRRKKLTSEELVRAYIARIEEVNPSLNAVVESRFDEAIKEAQHADRLIAKTNGDFEVVALYTRYPLLGIPFTVKESCGVKDLSFSVGSIVRKRLKCPENGHVVEELRTAGCIPLLVSANPEFCMNFETSSHTQGRCVNPYDLRRTSAGSSGGEGALNGCGATVFGVGSDIGGSIRLPALFCGVFGHKPTGGLTSVKGHFPNTKDPNFKEYLQIGPITRFARDLPVLLQIMAGDNKDKLKYDTPVQLKDIKIYYAYGFSGINGWTHPPVDFDIKLEMIRAIKCFEKIGMQTKELDMKCMQNSLEIAIGGLTSITGNPSIITQHATRKPSMKLLVLELINSLFGHSLFSRDVLFIEIMQRLNAFICPRHTELYKQETEQLKKTLTELLGTRGVLFLPTFHTSAICFNLSILNMAGVDLTLLFNILGFPATHVAMGLNGRGMPIGFQVIAAPYQDKLCLQIAAELEGAFGGWVPPLPHDIEN